MAVWSLADGHYVRVALAHELRGPRVVPFRRRGTRWELELDRADVDRIEYLLEVEYPGGRIERMLDPGNPLRAPGAFGEKSVLELPGYEPPGWTGDDESPGGEVRELTLGSVTSLLWEAPESDPAEPLPLLVVHDGPEYARYSQLPRLLDHLAAFGELPPFRAALIPPPGDRRETYSASARYARTLADEWLPALADAAPVAGRPVGVGASLGALALLHTHWVRPGTFAGLLLQSGSFFRRRFDSHESHFPRFDRIARFVSSVAGGRSHAPPLPVTITCGTGEENLDNNRFLASALARRGWDARLVEHRDAHNWISWRDVLHPHLAELVIRAL